MLNETVDTMALMMASYELDQAAEYLRASGKKDLADALLKLQTDAACQQAAISEKLDTPEGYIEQKINPRTGKADHPLSDGAIAQIKTFEPVTHERLKMLVAIENILPEGGLKNELKALNDKLAQTAPSTALPSINISKPAP